MRDQTALEALRAFASTLEQWVQTSVRRLAEAGVPMSQAAEDAVEPDTDPTRRPFLNRLFGSAPAGPQPVATRTVAGWP